LALPEQPPHLVISVLEAIELAYVRIGLDVLSGDESRRDRCSIIPTALPVLDLGATVTFKALRDRATNYSGPSVSS